jgi:hypothetical protein
MRRLASEALDRRDATAGAQAKVARAVEWRGLLFALQLVQHRAPARHRDHTPDDEALRGGFKQVERIVRKHASSRTTYSLVRAAEGGVVPCDRRRPAEPAGRGPPRRRCHPPQLRPRRALLRLRPGAGPAHRGVRVRARSLPAAKRSFAPPTMAFTHPGCRASSSALATIPSAP